MLLGEFICVDAYAGAIATDLLGVIPPEGCSKGVVPEATVFYCGNFGMLVVNARNTLVLHVCA